MTQMPGMVRLGRREVNRSHSPTVPDDDDVRSQTTTPPPPLIHTQVTCHMTDVKSLTLENRFEL